jgi:hypothetical protein
MQICIQKVLRKKSFRIVAAGAATMLLPAMPVL